MFRDKGVSIVEPDTPVRVVLFGAFLDEVQRVGFTSDGNCSHMTSEVRKIDFVMGTEKRLVFIYEFHE